MTKNKNIENLEKENYNILKFEYEKLQAENLKNTDMSYQIMRIFIPISIGLATYAITTYSDLTDLRLSAIAIISIVLLLYVYVVDRRLTYTNQIRNARIELIENSLNMWNYRLFNKKEFELNASDILKMKVCDKKRKFKHKKIIKIRVHNLFEIYLAIYMLVWSILILYKLIR